MYGKLQDLVTTELQSIRDQALYKEERVLESPQGREITIDGKTLLNFCSNNYLGLANHPSIREAAHRRALGLWSSLGAFYLRHPNHSQGVGSGHCQVPGHRRRRTVLLVLHG